MVEVGQAVLVVDEKRQKHHGLVTAVHGYNTKEERDEEYRRYQASPNGNWSEEQLKRLLDSPFSKPSINVVYVSADETKRDPYGNQLERMSSLQHREVAAASMGTPGRYWDSL